jgi:hypothetical protein
MVVQVRAYFFQESSYLHKSFKVTAPLDIRTLFNVELRGQKIEEPEKIPVFECFIDDSIRILSPGAVRVISKPFSNLLYITRWPSWAPKGRLLEGELRRALAGQLLARSR